MYKRIPKQYWRIKFRAITQLMIGIAYRNVADCHYVHLCILCFEIAIYQDYKLIKVKNTYKKETGHANEK